VLGQIVNYQLLLLILKVASKANVIHPVIVKCGQYTKLPDFAHN